MLALSAVLYIYGAGASLPVLWLQLGTTRGFNWGTFSAAFLASLAFPVFVIAWLLSD